MNTITEGPTRPTRPIQLLKVIDTFVRSLQHKYGGDPRITATDRVLLEIMVKRDHLEMMKRGLTLEVNELTMSALRSIKSGKRQEALYDLKRKKAKEKLLHQVTTMRGHLLTMIDSIEMAQMQADVLDALKNGNEALKSLNDQMDVDMVMQMVSSEVDRQKELEQAFLDAQLGSQSDDKDLQEEIDQLSTAAIVELPNVPLTTPTMTVEKKRYAMAI